MPKINAVDIDDQNDEENEVIYDADGNVVDLNDDEDLDNDDENLDEETAAAATLRPGSRKADMMQKLVGVASDMNKQDLSAWLTKSLALIGHEADTIPSGAAERNRSSVAAKSAPTINIKEDLADLFGGDETLTEEFKENASTLFEAVVSTRVQLEVERLEEEYNDQFEAELNEAIEEINTETLAKIDSYLDYVVEEWMTENEVAITHSLKSELTEDFIRGIKGVFLENYIELPEERLDIVEALAEEVEELQDRLAEEINEKIELKKIVEDTNREAIIEGISEGLTLSQADKFKTLAENVDYTDDESYISKLTYIKENVFSGKKTASPQTTNMMVEETEELNTDERPVVSSAVSRYVENISRHNK